MNKLWKEIMKTPGPIRVQLLLLLTLTASSVLSTGLQISSRVSNTSDENILLNAGSLEVQDAKLRVRVTGKHTTDLLKNLKETGNFWGTELSEEK